MADADTKETSQAPDLSKIVESLTGLGDVVKSVQAQQQQIQEGLLTLANANKRQADPVDDNIYDPQVLMRKTNQTINQTVENALKEERQRNYTMASLAQEYPEINSGDAKVREAILNAQKKLPLEMQGSAIGYEMSIKSAMADLGIVPSSKRPTKDDDFQMPSRGGASAGSKKRGKVAQETLDAAALMGVDITDEKVIERLQKNSERNYGKYR